MEITDFSDVKGVYWPLLWPETSRPLAESGLSAARTAGVSSFIAECPTAKGTPKWWDVTITALPGARQQYVVISRDITASRAEKIAERNAFDRLRTIMRSNSDVLWDIDLQQDKVWWSEGMQSAFGYGPAQIGESTKWCHEHIHPDDRARVVESMATAVANGSATWEGEFRYLTAAGTYVEVLDRGTIIRDGEGKALRFVGIMRDVTARNAVMAAHKLVAGELVHRVNNILAVVTGLFQQSLRESPDKETLGASFGGRLVALANANTAILRSAGDGAALESLTQTQLAPFIDAGRLTVEGPPVMLPQPVAQPVALALNELATNALKYGALSNATGVVRLSWTVSGEQGDRRLAIRWSETGGPPVEKPKRIGLGSRLIENGIRGAMVNRLFAAKGFSCSIELPI